MKKIIPFLFLILLSPVINAQKNSTGNWLIYSGNKHINDKWNWTQEVQYRSYNALGDLQQLLFRTGIGYNLTENNNNILIGYGFMHSGNYIPGTDINVKSDEHRIYQQFTTKQKFGIFYTQHRYRIEERFLPGKFAMRLRYSVGMNVPITSKTMLSKTLYAAASNEIFLRTKSPIFDANRLYGALGYTFSKNIKTELGFMAQTREHSNRNQVMVSLLTNF